MERRQRLKGVRIFTGRAGNGDPIREGKSSGKQKGVRGMRSIDWNAWMKEHHIYIPTYEEAQKAKKLGKRKVKPPKTTKRETPALL